MITGNLNVIPDPRVRNIIFKGPKYRFPRLSKVCTFFSSVFYPFLYNFQFPFIPFTQCLRSEGDFSLLNIKQYYFQFIKQFTSQINSEM